MLSQLLLIEAALDRIQQKQEILMANLQNFKDLLAAVDIETTRIADKIADLVSQLESGGLSEAAEAEVLAGLQAQVDRLKTIGHNPADPIPPVPTV